MAGLSRFFAEKTLVPLPAGFSRAMKNLRKLGYKTGLNLSAVKMEQAFHPDSPKEVAYSRQDRQLAPGRGYLPLSWTGDAPEIIQAFADADVPVLWNGQDSGAICVEIKPKN